MLSLLCGVAAYVVTFILLLGGYHYLRNRRLAKRGSAPDCELKKKTKSGSDHACQILLAAALTSFGVVVLIHPGQTALAAVLAPPHLHDNDHSAQKGNHECGTSDASQPAHSSSPSPSSTSSDANGSTQRRATK